MANRSARLITKRTSVPNKIPTGTTGSESNFIQSGELASNLADRKLFGYDGTDVFEYGSNSYLGLTGGTLSGDLYVTGNFTAGTIFSGDTDLYDIFLTTADGNDITRVQPGTNINTGGTANEPIVNLNEDVIIDSLTAETRVYTKVLEISGQTMTAGTVQMLYATDANPSAFCIRRTDAGGYMCYMDNANFPQIMMGNSTNAVAGYIDVENDGNLFLNALHDGAVFIGGGLQPSAASIDIGSQTATTWDNAYIDNVWTNSISSSTLSADTIYSGGTDLEEFIITETKILDLYQSGTTNTSGGTGTWNAMEWDSVGLEEGGLYSRTTTDITINSNGIYEIEYSISLDRASGGRSIGTSRLMRDQGGGFSFVGGSTAFSYNRNTTSGEGTMSKKIKRRLTSGDVLRVEFGIHQGGGSLSTIANASNITITRVSR